MKRKKHFTIDDYLSFSAVHPDFKETYAIEKFIFEILSKRKKISLKQLEEIFIRKNLSLEKMRYVIEKLLREGKLYISRRDELSLIKHKKTYIIKIERIYRGGATVLINNKFRARLKDYNSPISVKKGEIYEIIGELYKEDDVLNLKIFDIVKKLK